MTAEVNHTTRVTVQGAYVHLSLPDGAYVRMTPAQAKSIGALLIAKSAQARGKDAPSVVFFTREGELA